MSLLAHLAPAIARRRLRARAAYARAKQHELRIPEQRIDSTGDTWLDDNTPKEIIIRSSADPRMERARRKLDEGLRW